MLKNSRYVYGDDSLYVPAHLNYAKYMLHKFQEYGDNVALIDPVTGTSMTYNSLAQLTVDIALSLSHAGVEKGDFVSICSEERLEYMPTALAVMCAGAVFSSTDTSGQDTIKHRMALTKPKIVFCSPAAYKLHKEALQSVAGVEKFVVFGEDPEPGAILFKDFVTEHADIKDFEPVPIQGWNDNAMVLYSSGTTGLPKAVPITHLNVMMDMFMLIDVDYYKGKKVLTATEFYTYGLSCLHAGATVVFSLKDEAKDIIEAIDRFKIQILQQMPSTLFPLAQMDIQGYDSSALEHILSASAPLTPKLVEDIRKKFPTVKKVCQAYGATEAGVMCSDERAPKGNKPASVGIACPGVVIKVVDVDTQEAVEVNKRGEIRFKSPSVFPGYIGDESSNHLDEEGYYKTGDIGYYDEDDYFYIVDRIKDMIKYHGFAVAPAELERVLLGHGAVLEAAVVGKPDERYFELPTAFVVLAPGAQITEEQLTAYVNEKVAHWMPLAGGARFLESLPRGRRGKVDRKALRIML